MCLNIDKRALKFTGQRKELKEPNNVEGKQGGLPGSHFKPHGNLLRRGAWGLAKQQAQRLMQQKRCRRRRQTRAQQEAAFAQSCISRCVMLSPEPAKQISRTEVEKQTRPMQSPQGWQWRSGKPRRRLLFPANVAGKLGHQGCLGAGCRRRQSALARGHPPVPPSLGPGASAGPTLPGLGASAWTFQPFWVCLGPRLWADVHFLTNHEAEGQFRDSVRSGQCGQVHAKGCACFPKLPAGITEFVQISQMRSEPVPGLILASKIPSRAVSLCGFLSTLLWGVYEKHFFCLLFLN